MGESKTLNSPERNNNSRPSTFSPLIGVTVLSLLVDYYQIIETGQSSVLLFTVDKFLRAISSNVSKRLATNRETMVVRNRYLVPT